jgi:hypothetical protein
MGTTAPGRRQVWIVVAALAVGLAALWALSTMLRQQATAAKPDYTIAALTVQEPALARIPLDIPAASEEDFEPRASVANIWEPYGWQLTATGGSLVAWSVPESGVRVALPALSDDLRQLNDLAKLLPPIESVRSSPWALSTAATDSEPLTSPVRILLPDASGSSLTSSLPGGSPAAVPALPSLPALPRR